MIMIYWRYGGVCNINTVVIINYPVSANTDIICYNFLLICEILEITSKLLIK